MWNIYIAYGEENTAIIDSTSDQMEQLRKCSGAVSKCSGAVGKCSGAVIKSSGTVISLPEQL